MSEDQARVDAVQRAIVKFVANSPAGHNLQLIGGFRYRFLDQSVRASEDIDYHWTGDLGAKQRQLTALFEKRLLPHLRRQFGYEGRVDGTGPADESPAVKTVVLSLWKPGSNEPKLEVPVEVTRVVCADSPEVRTMEGMVFPTLSDADLIESKLLAVVNRRYLAHRDLTDAFLFQDKLLPESPARLAKKMKTLGLGAADVKKVLDDLEKHAAHHAKSVQAIVDGQLDPASAKNINAAGGGKMILVKTFVLLRTQFGVLK
jgi:hypothetical protein